MNRGLSRFASLCAAILLVAAARVHAGELRFLSPAAGDRFSPGSVVEVAWSGAEPFGATARSFDEIELLLFIDDGRVAPIRISLGMAAGTDRFSWRVPAFRAPHAHLAIRTGWEGDLGAEQIAGVSGDFSIDPSEPAYLEALFRVEGEWRTAQALTGSERPLLPPPAVGSMPQIHSLGPTVFALASDQQSLSAPQWTSEPAEDDAVAQPQRSSPASPSRFPAPIPLRS